MRVELTTTIFREGEQFVSYTPELDVSSCGARHEEAQANLDEAVRLFLAEAAESGMIEETLQQCRPSPRC